MSTDIQSIVFDYGDLPAEKVMECEAAHQAACSIENQAVILIGEQFAKVKENLKYLRNGNGFVEWCEKRAGITLQTAYNYINAFERRESIKLFESFGKAALFMLAAPSTPQEARETDRLIKRHINTTRYLLLDMRDRKGWKALGYESFVEYGEKELGFASTHLYRLAESAEISLQIGYSPIGENVQPPEGQLRPLTQVPESVRKEIWDEATRKAEEAGKKVTAKAVSEAVEEWKQRSEDWRQQSNGQRKKIRDLESQIDLLQSRPA